MKALIAAAVLLGLTLGQCMQGHATDRGQYANVPEHIRAWFKSVKSPSGVGCCDIADGHRLDGDDVDYRGDRTKVRIEGKWHEVPVEAEVHDVGNPVGQAVVWYTRFNDGGIYIRCFVDGAGG